MPLSQWLWMPLKLGADKTLHISWIDDLTCCKYATDHNTPKQLKRWFSKFTQHYIKEKFLNVCLRLSTSYNQASLSLFVKFYNPNYFSSSRCWRGQMLRRRLWPGPGAGREGGTTSCSRTEWSAATSASWSWSSSCSSLSSSSCHSSTPINTKSSKPRERKGKLSF